VEAADTTWRIYDADQLICETPAPAPRASQDLRSANRSSTPIPGSAPRLTVMMLPPSSDIHSKTCQVTPDTVTGCVIGTRRNSYSYR
jgi:hypothetical protein